MGLPRTYALSWHMLSITLSLCHVNPSSAWIQDVPVAGRRRSQLETYAATHLRSGDVTSRWDALRYGAAILACVEGEQWGKALKLWGEMQADGVDPDANTYGAALSACGGTGQWERARALLCDMEASGLVPDVAAYNQALKACGKRGAFEQARALMGEMRERGVTPDVVSYNKVINACAKGGLMEKAETAQALLEELRERGLTPDVKTYSAVLSACAKSPNPQGERVAALLSEILTRGEVEPDIVIYTAAMSVYGKEGQWERALALLEKVTQCGLKPNDITYGTVINALPASELDKAREVLTKAISEGYFQVWNAGGIFDLHLESNVASASAPVANALLYHTLCEYAEGSRRIEGDLEVVTGRGRRSDKRKGPTLPTSTRTFLTKVMDPPLEIRDDPANPGSFIVTAASLTEWVDARMCNEGTRLLQP